MENDFKSIIIARRLALFAQRSQEEYHLIRFGKRRPTEGWALSLEDSHKIAPAFIFLLGLTPP